MNILKARQMDLERHQNLHCIIMLREIIRKWWKAELHFADRHGGVMDWQRGGDIPPTPNECCRLSLGSREGLRRCTQSVRQLHEQFRANRRLRRALVQPCHLQFSLVGAPLYVLDEYEGFLFVEGFLREPPSDKELEALGVRLRELVPGAPGMERAAERPPVLGQEHLEKLADLLEYGAGEIAAYEAERARKEERALPELAPGHGEHYRFEDIIGRSGP
ncbi:MAG: PocR ligand-binding domain-containing protein, partial [Archangium sp.]